MDFLKYFSYYSPKMMISPYYFSPPVLKDPVYTGWSTSDNEPDGIKNATHNTFSKRAGCFNFSSQLFSEM
jgi:hypothetical protein